MATLEVMSQDERESILKARQEIIRLLVDKVTINSRREVIIEGFINESAAAQFELGVY